MNSVSYTDIESELSYALLHAVAAKVGASCVISNRLSDNRGIDACLTFWDNDPSVLRTEVDLKIQLKATVKTPVDDGNYFSYSLSNSHYDDLRAETYSTPRILVVFFLPKLHDDWLNASESELTIRRAAYWVSLKGAAASTNGSDTTVYVPKNQLLTSSSLKSLFKNLASGNIPKYTGKV